MNSHVGQLFCIIFSSVVIGSTAGYYTSLASSVSNNVHANMASEIPSHSGMEPFYVNSTVETLADSASHQQLISRTAHTSLPHPEANASPQVMLPMSIEEKAKAEAAIQELRGKMIILIRDERRRIAKMDSLSDQIMKTWTKLKTELKLAARHSSLSTYLDDIGRDVSRLNVSVRQSSYKLNSKLNELESLVNEIELTKIHTSKVKIVTIQQIADDEYPTLLEAHCQAVKELGAFTERAGEKLEAVFRR